MNPHVRRIADHCVKTADLHDCWKLCIPIKGVDPVAILVFKQADLFVLVKVRTDEGVAAFDIVTQIRQRAFAPHLELARQRILVFSFEDLEQEAELGHFHGLAIDVHAVNIV